MNTALDTVVRDALTSLARHISHPSWHGRREREVVSLFLTGHLLARCAPGTTLFDPSQVAIEVAVPQTRGQRGRTAKTASKTQVCKDLVIWPRPAMTCWDEHGMPTVRPLSVIEWKHNEAEISA